MSFNKDNYEILLYFNFYILLVEVDSRVNHQISGSPVDHHE